MVENTKDKNHVVRDFRLEFAACNLLILSCREPRLFPRLLNEMKSATRKYLGPDERELLPLLDDVRKFLEDNQTVILPPADVSLRDISYFAIQWGDVLNDLMHDFEFLAAFLRSKNYEKLLDAKLKNFDFDFFRELNELIPILARSSFMTELGDSELAQIRELLQKTGAESAEDFLSSLAFIARATKRLISGRIISLAAKEAQLERRITFSPEHLRAGRTILSNFATLLDERFPSTEISVSIEQNGKTITMRVTGADGIEEAVEHSLDDYMAMVRGERDASSLSNDERTIHRLESALEIAKMELRQERRFVDVLRTENDQQRAQIAILNEDVRDAFRVISALVDSNASRDNLLSDLLARMAASQNGRVASALNDVASIVRSGRIESEMLRAESSLRVISSEDPGLASRIINLLDNSFVGSAGGGIIVEILKKLTGH